jgi:hypothetical protein
VFQDLNLEQQPPTTRDFGRADQDDYKNDDGDGDNDTE